MKNLFSFFKRKTVLPPTPSRITKCSICGKGVKTTIMEGDVAHILCICEKEEKDDADKAQIELIKRALREYLAETAGSKL